MIEAIKRSNLRGYQARSPKPKPIKFREATYQAKNKLISYPDIIPRGEMENKRGVFIMCSTEKKMYASFNLFPMQMGMVIDALRLMEKKIDRQQKNHNISIAIAQSDKYWIREMIGQMEAGLEECGCNADHGKESEEA